MQIKGKSRILDFKQKILGFKLRLLGLKNLLLLSITMFTLSFEMITLGATTDTTVISLEINEQELPAVTNVSITIPEHKKDTQHVTLTNTYKMDILSSEVVGIVGVPIEIYSNESLDGAQLTFQYNPEWLGEVQQEDLVIMWYDREEQWYQVITDSSHIDYKNHTITCPIKEDGTYLVEDVKTWQAVWNGTYDYDELLMYETIDVEYDWKEEFAPNDLSRIADISWYSDEQEIYHISTASELAGLAVLVNEGNNFLGKTIILDRDIDLKEYKWESIGWSMPCNGPLNGQDYPFCGTFDGNYHKIKNMSIHTTRSNVGLFGRTMIGFSVNNLGLENCSVKGEYYVGGIVGDNISPESDDLYCMENCYVTGKIEGEACIGALVASTAKMNIRNCYATAHVACMDDTVGGLVGNLRGGSIKDSYYAGKIGMKEVEGEKYYLELSGGIVGEGGIECDNPQYESQIENCFYNNVLNPGLNAYGGGAFTKETKANIEKMGVTASYLASNKFLKQLGVKTVWINKHNINQGMPYIKYFEQEM